MPDNDSGEAGGNVLLAIPLIGNGLFTATIAFVNLAGLQQVLTIGFGLWMLVLGHLLLLARPAWLYGAVATYLWLALNALLAIALGIMSKIAFIWVAICVAAAIYSFLKVRRIRRGHAI